MLPHHYTQPNPYPNLNPDPIQRSNLVLSLPLPLSDSARSSSPRHATPFLCTLRQYWQVIPTLWVIPTLSQPRGGEWTNPHPRGGGGEAYGADNSSWFSRRLHQRQCQQTNTHIIIQNPQDSASFSPWSYTFATTTTTGWYSRTTTREKTPCECCTVACQARRGPGGASAVHESSQATKERTR